MTDDLYPNELLMELVRARSEGPAEAARAEEEVAKAYMPMARRLASRFTNAGADWDDLVQVANLALLRAIRRFDPERGIFEAYANATINGELKRYLRDQCWTVKPPRRVQELQSRLLRATEEVAQADGSSPDAAALAVALEAEVDEVSEALSARSCYSPSSLDRPSQTTGRPLGDSIADDDEPFEQVEGVVTLLQICRGLPTDDLDLIRMRFYENLSQREIADELGISQMQVSRRLSRLLSSLRSKSQAYEVA